MGHPKPIDAVDPTQLLVDRAQQAIKAKDWQKALSCLQALGQWLRRQPKVSPEARASALISYARCLLALGRAPEAQQALRQALRLASLPEAKELYGNTLLALGRWKAALRYARHWLHQQPKEWRAHLLLARVYAYRNKHESARFSLIAALYHGVDAPQAFQSVAEQLEQQGRLREAILVIRRAIQKFPKEPSLVVTLGLLLQKARQFRQALEWLERAIELGEDSPTVRLVLGQICSDLGRIDEAIAHIQRGLEQAPNHLELLDLLSFVCLQKGRLADALTALSRILEITPTDPLAHFKLASVHYQMGNYVEAVRAYRRVMALAPGSEVAQEAQEILDMLDHVQLEQVFVLSMEDPVFRASLIRDPRKALETRGFVLSEGSLEIIANTDFSRLPKRWRSPQIS